MPRRYKKRRYKRKKKSSWLSKTGNPSPSYPIGKTFKFKTRYASTFSLDAGVGGIPISRTYSLNGLYDPDITGSGHQPIGFDQLMPLYDHYQVIGARATVTFSNTAAEATQVMLTLRDTAAVIGDIERFRENGLNKYAVLAPSGSGGDTKTLAINCSVVKYFGGNIFNEITYKGDIANNPADQVYLHVTVAPLTTTNILPVTGSILIEYIAIFTEPKMLIKS